jgi:WD40 repeat protein
LGGTIKLWDLATGQCRQTLGRDGLTVDSVAFLPDGTLASRSRLDRIIKLWDMATGQCRQSLYINEDLFYLSFDTICSRLYTHRGTILLHDYRGYGVSPDGVWITWNSEKLLRLPPEYRPVRWAVAGSALTLGCSLGRVLIFQFSADPSVW